MQDSPPETDSEVHLPVVKDPVYHCVCGYEYAVKPDRGGQCPFCFRRVSGEALQDAYEATVSLSSLQSSARDCEVDLAPADAMTDRVFGHFKLERQLGQGGMGAVYRALDTSLQRYVAVKVMRKKGADFSQRVNDMLREAVAQARLNHPNVVTIYYVGRQEEEPFLAMELLPGPTLAERIKRQGTIPYPEAIEYGIQVASALKHATIFDLIHADIKPANLILAGEGRVKISDFGLARTRERQGNQESNSLAGTPSYVAPELLRGGSYSIQSDMYAVGVTLFEMVFARLPVELKGESLQAKLESLLDSQIDFPNPWPNAVPQEFKTLLQRLLANNPEDRYANYDELLDALRDIAPVSTTPAGFAPRLMAYTVDQACLLLAMAPFAISIFSIQASRAESRQLLIPILAFASLIVPALYLFLIYKGWPSFGRYLFQLRIVEEHGLPPRREQLVPREVLRNAFAWLFPLALYLSLQSVSLSKGIEYSLIGVLGLNSIALFLLGRRKALHDYLCHSNVVLAFNKSELKA
ncbi:MAG: protein kinase domain-containing protein [Pirellula sp.]